MPLVVVADDVDDGTEVVKLEPAVGEGGGADVSAPPPQDVANNRAVMRATTYFTGRLVGMPR